MKDELSAQMYGLVARQLADDGHHQLALDVLKTTTNGTSELDYTMPSHLLANTLFDISREDLPGTDNPDPTPYHTKYVTTHKGSVTAAAFSSDGSVVATGSSDNSIKLLDVNKMHYHSQLNLDKHTLDTDDLRPVIRTLYDHNSTVRALVFHPWRNFIISASNDCSVKYFEYTKTNQRRSCRQIIESTPVNSIALHATGDYILVATQNPTIKLYDVSAGSMLQAYSPATGHSAPINKLAWGSSMAVSVSDDGHIKLWDPVSFECTRTIENAHAGESVTSVSLTRSDRHILTSGQDGTSKLWDTTTGKQLMVYEGAQQSQLKLESVFTQDESYVLGCDESSSAIVQWNSLTGELVRKLDGHSKPVTSLAVSPTEPAFMSCSDDGRGRFWNLNGKL